MRKDILIATNLSLIAGLGLSACKANGAVPFNLDSQPNNPTPTEPVVTPEGMGPYTSNYINKLDPFLEKNIRENAKSQGIELYESDPQGFCVEYTGVASANGKAEDCFVIFTDQAGTQNVFRKTWDGQNFGIEKLGIENITDPDGNEWTTLFDSEGNTVFKVPQDSEAQFEQNGTVTAFITPEDGILGMMPTYDGNMFEVKVTKSAPHDALVRFKKELRPTLPQEVKEKFDMAGIEMADMQNAEYDKDGLHITLASGEVIVLTNTDLQKGIYNGQDNVLQYRDETNPNAIYAFDKATGKWEVEESKEYPICTPENFRDCPIPVEDLFNGNYHRWLKTLSQPFDPEKIKFVPMQIDREAIIYQTSTAPNYEDPETRPFRRNVTSAITELTAEDGRTYRYRILPVEYADPTDPGNPDKNVWVIGFSTMNKIDFKQNTIGEESESMIQVGLDMWMNNMNIAPIVIGYKYPLTNIPLALAQKTWNILGDEEMTIRMERFRQGDPSALDGLVVKLTIARITQGKEIYK